MDGHVWSVSIRKMPVANRLDLNDKKVMNQFVPKCGLSLIRRCEDEIPQDFEGSHYRLGNGCQF